MFSLVYRLVVTLDKRDEEALTEWFVLNVVLEELENLQKLLFGSVETVGMLVNQKRNLVEEKDSINEDPRAPGQRSASQQ